VNKGAGAWMKLKWGLMVQKLKSAGFDLDRDVAAVEADDQSMHDKAEKFDPKTEKLYNYLMIMTASFMSFAHGSNDVANAVGPLSAIYHVWKHSTVDVSGKVPVPIWILVFGGVGIDVGLTVYGWMVLKVLANKITYMSPTRGFSMELGTVLTVLTASKLGLPISTTHCITGATLGVGLCNMDFKSVNWKLFGNIFLSWIVTVPCTALIAGLLCAFASHSPKA